VESEEGRDGNGRGWRGEVGMRGMGEGVKKTGTDSYGSGEFHIAHDTVDAIAFLNGCLFGGGGGDGGYVPRVPGCIGGKWRSWGGLEGKRGNGICEGRVSGGE